MSAGPWIDDATPRRNATATGLLSGDVACETVVIGGGIAGLSIARQLAEQGRDVLLLEAGQIGSGASGRNAGFLLADGARSYAYVSATRGPEVAANLRAIGLGTRAVVNDLGARHPEIALEPCGSLRLAGDAEERDQLERTAAQVGQGLCFLDAAELPHPWRRIGRFEGGLEDPGDGLLHPLRLVRALRERLEAAGGRAFEQTAVNEIESRPASVHCRTAQGSVRAESVVVATNAWTRRLLPVALRPVRAQMLEAQVQPVPEWPQAMYANGGADYWRRYGADRVLVGGRRSAGGATEETDAAVPGDAVQAALDRLLGVLIGSTAEARVVRRWAGIMAFTPDGLPLAGRLSTDARIYLLAGLNGQGMGWAPGLAALLAEAMAGRERILPRCFAPDRFDGPGHGATG